MKPNRSVLAGLWAFLLLGLGTLQAADVTRAGGPLRVHPSNSRYFTADGSKAVLLTGSHTWDNLQDMGTGNPPGPFDYEAYLEFLSRHHHNFFRLWRWEILDWDTRANDGKNGKRLFVEPHPWRRTGPGTALDGGPRFDLYGLDDAYFERLRSRAVAAGRRGMYASVMLFEGWALQHTTNAWRAHPFHPENHVNGLDPDLDRDGLGLEVHTLRVPAVTRVQEAYVRKVVETLNDLDNVLYEIVNESGSYSTEWQAHFIRYVKEVEGGLGRRHPVGFTFQYSRDRRHKGSNATLFASQADWVSPNPEATGGFDYRTNPPVADGGKVVLSDTDHLWGIGGDIAWVWKTFLRGHHPIFMDPYAQGVLLGGTKAKWEPVRSAMGVVLRLAERVDLAALRPQREVPGAEFCLASSSGERIAWVPDSGGMTLDLAGVPGRFTVEWIDPVSGDAVRGGDLEGGAARTITPPGPVPVVVHIGSASR